MERAGIKVDTYYSSEIDKYAIQVTQNNYPETIQLGDVNDIDFSEFINKIDLLIGGSPCQGFSQSGKGLNFEDPRSKLFFKFVEALNIIKPKYFLLENVKMKKEWQDIISDCLGIEPIMINSNLVSGQHRKRLYWTNIPRIEQPKDKNIKLQDILENGYTDREKTYCLDASYYKGGNLKQYFEKSRRQIVFRSIEDYEYCKVNYRDINIKQGSEWRHLTPIECERLQGLDDNYTKLGLMCSLQMNSNKEINGGLHICDNVVLKDVIIKSLTEKQNYVINTILDLKDMGQQNSQEIALMEVSNVWLKTVKENNKPMMATVSCIIKDKQEQGALNSLVRLISNANIVIEWQLQEECVVSIIKIGHDIMTLNTPIKINQNQIIMDIQNLRENIESSIGKLQIENLEENLDKEKLYIILTLINRITLNLIYMSAKTSVNILVCINNLTVSQGNLLSWNISYLRTENIELISNSQRYKMIGNGWNIDTIVHIFKNIPNT